ncbi:MAG TPA: sugar phosphate isomerase/epimerase [Firmicutes bacterium]|nr:sugar phosphate isomerase/epimerase [Bacillota bacterium]
MKINCCWIYAISKYGYPPSIPDVYKAIKEMADLGFEYIELEGVRRDNLMEVYRNKEDIKRFCDDLGLKVVNFCPILPDLVSLDAAKRKEALDLFRVGVEIANFFGCTTIQTDSYTPPLEFVGSAPYKEMINYGIQFKVKIDEAFSWSALWGALVDSIAKCNEYAKDAGLKFTLEPRVGEIISNTDALLRLMDAVDDENFGAVLDTAHQHAQKEVLPLSVEKLGHRIYYLHVADNDGRDNLHLGLGKGTVDWDGVFTALKKHRFDGFVAIDVGRVPNIEEEYRASMRFLQEMAERVGL